MEQPSSENPEALEAEPSEAAPVAPASPPSVQEPPEAAPVAPTSPPPAQNGFKAALTSASQFLQRNDAAQSLGKTAYEQAEEQRRALVTATEGTGKEERSEGGQDVGQALLSTVQELGEGTAQSAL